VNFKVNFEDDRIQIKLLEQEEFNDLYGSSILRMTDGKKKNFPYFLKME